ncbi:MAG TPA: hypothetical protein DEF75_08195 [Comamonas kerstersii]|nr:hypothetical protein [Comamonas kerstersii]
MHWCSPSAVTVELPTPLTHGICLQGYARGLWVNPMSINGAHRTAFQQATHPTGENPDKA